LVVLAILVLIAAAWPFAAPRLFPNQQLRSEIHILLGHLRSARLRARLSGTVQAIEWTELGLWYQDGPERHDLPGGMVLKSTDAAGARPAHRVQFYPDGSCNGTVLEIVRGDLTSRIQVGAVTGRSEIVE
jgi:hypothetical protein